MDASKWMREPYSGNCADFVRDVLLQDFGKSLDIPQFGGVMGREYEAVCAIDQYQGQTRQVTTPQNGDIVLMLMSGLPVHIGVFNDGSVLHIMNRRGDVMNTPISRLGRMGHPVVGYFRV